MQNDFTPDSGPQSICAPANHSECELRLDRPAPAGTHRTSSMRLLRLPQVIHRTGLKKPHSINCRRMVPSQCESRSRHILLDGLRRKSMRGSREEWLRANGFAKSEQRDLRVAEPAEHGGYRGQFPRYSRLPCPVSGNIMVRRLVLCASTFGT
jgi:hypothetical protein